MPLLPDPKDKEWMAFVRWAQAHGVDLAHKEDWEEWASCFHAGFEEGVGQANDEW